MTDTLPRRSWSLIHGLSPNAYDQIPDRSVHAVVGSPPYFAQRDYDPNDPDWAQLGQEDEPEQFVDNLVDIYRPLLTKLRLTGGLYVVIGDTRAGSGGAGGDYNAAGLRAGQPRYEGTAAKARRGVHRPDPRLGHARIEGGVTGRRGHGSGGYELHKPKDLIGVPWMFAQAMKAAGWYWRDDTIWAKPNPMPEGPQDRTAKAHEYVWLFTPSPKTYWDHYVIQEPAVPRVIARKGKRPIKLVAPRRLRRSVWTVPVSSGHRSAAGSHFATYPEALAARCIQALTPEVGVCGTCGEPPVRRTKRDPVTKQLNHLGWDYPDCGHAWDPVGATVLDNFNGAGTTGIAALRRGRSYIGIDPVAANIAMSVERIAKELPVLAHAGRVTRHLESGDLA